MTSADFAGGRKTQSAFEKLKTVSAQAAMAQQSSTAFSSCLAWSGQQSSIGPAAVIDIEADMLGCFVPARALPATGSMVIATAMAAASMVRARRMDRVMHTGISI